MPVADCIDQSIPVVAIAVILIHYLAVSLFIAQ